MNHSINETNNTLVMENLDTINAEESIYGGIQKNNRVQESIYGGSQKSINLNVKMTDFDHDQDSPSRSP